jgi:hypothetical protein
MRNSVRQARTEQRTAPNLPAPTPRGNVTAAAAVGYAPAPSENAAVVPTAPAPAAVNTWEQILRNIERNLNPGTFTSWFRHTKQEQSQNGTLVVSVPSDLHLKRLTKTHRKLLQDTLTEMGMAETKLEFVLPRDEAAPPQPIPSATPQEAPKGEKCPILPEAAWYGLSREYREIVGPCTEASHSYHLACFVAAVGACLERNVYVERAGRHYPNLFVVLVGPSGGARKSTALRFGLDLVAAVDRKILVAWTIDSREGFLQDLSDRGKLNGHRRGVHAILRLDELRALIDKSRMEGLGNIVPMLTHAYDCPPSLDVRTRKNSLSVPQPTLSLVAATTWDWLEGIKSPDLLGGLGNRTMWVAGQPGDAIPDPPKRDPERWDGLVQKLRTLIAHWRKSKCTEVSLSAEAAARWKRIYGEIYGHRSDDPLIATLCERMQNHCLKVALIFAVLDRQSVIELHHLEAAYTFTQFLYDCLWHVFRGFGMSPTGKLESKITDLFHRTDMHTFNRCLDDLLRTGGPLVREIVGRKVVLYGAEFKADG